MLDLMPYQTAGANFLAGRTRALLADEPGLGKTAQAIRACDAVGARSVLVVCPASVVETWYREFERFRMGNWTASVVSYDTARKLVAPYPPIDVLILDEAHYLKSRDAKRTQAIFGPKCDGSAGLVGLATRVFLLTGTPAPNNPSELWPMLRACAPETIMGTRKPLAFWPFAEKFCVVRDTGFGWTIVKGRNLDQLKAQIAPFVLRRKKTDVLRDLPALRTAELAVRADDALRGIAKLELADGEQIRRALEEHGVAGLAKIAPHVAELRRAVGLAKVGPTVDWIKDWFAGGGGKLVVFAHHRDVIAALRLAIDPYLETDSAAIHGATSSGTRQFEIDRFQDDPTCQVFIGQIQAAGTGITLTASSDVLFLESSWVPAENEQAMMRVHRIGQRNACLARFVMLAGSLDVQIQRACMRKTADIVKLFG